MGQPILDLITEFSIMYSKGEGKFRSKQFECKKRLDLLTEDVLLKNVVCQKRKIMYYDRDVLCSGKSTGGQRWSREG